MLVTVATVRAMVRFAIPVGLDFELLGRSFEVASELGQITMELPRVEWVGDRPNTLPPTRAEAIYTSSFSDHLFAQSEIYRWGSVAESRAAERTGAMHVDAALASIDLDDALIERGGSVRGLGAPAGAAIHQFRLSITEWRTKFVRWAALIAGQVIDPDLPPAASSVVEVAAGTMLWIDDGARLVGPPSFQSGQVNIVVGGDDPAGGILIDEAILDRLLTLTAAADQPTTQLALLGRARAAIQRHEYRVAMIELGSAAELCLWNTFTSTVRTLTPKEMSTWTLGTLVRQCYGASDPMRDTFTRGIVDPRNDAIHRALDCTRDSALEAFTLVRQLVSDELPEPLPVRDP